MKKLFIMSLVLSAGIVLSACESSSKEEQVKNEIIQKSVSDKLEKIIKDKTVKKAEVPSEDAEIPLEDLEEAMTPPPIDEIDIVPPLEEEPTEPLLEETEKKREA